MLPDTQSNNVDQPVQVERPQLSTFSTFGNLWDSWSIRKRKSFHKLSDLNNKAIRKCAQSEFLASCISKKIIPNTFRIKLCNLELSDNNQQKVINNCKNVELNVLRISSKECKLSFLKLAEQFNAEKLDFISNLSHIENDIFEKELECRSQNLKHRERNRYKNKVFRLQSKKPILGKGPDPHNVPIGPAQPGVKKKKRRFIKRSKYRRKLRRLARKPIQSLVMNYSSIDLTFGQKSLLEKHLNFVPLPERVNKTQTLYDIKRFSRAMRWKEVWGSSDDSAPIQKIFTQKKHNLPQVPPSKPLERFLYGVESDLLQFDNQNIPSNLSKEEKEALKELISLQKLGRIVIQRCDKGGAVAIMDRDQYMLGIEEHLKSSITREDGSILPVYREIDEIMPRVYYDNIKMAANQGVEDGIITKDIAEQLVPPAPSNGRAYGMPKAHKEVEEGKSIPPLRLVISGCGSNTEPASHFLDFHARKFQNNYIALLKIPPTFLGP